MVIDRVNFSAPSLQNQVGHQGKEEAKKKSSLTYQGHVYTPSSKSPLVAEAASSFSAQTLFLDPMNQAANLERLSSIDPLNMMPSLCTYNIYKTVPTLNHIFLGNESEAELENRLGKDALASIIGATSLAIFLESFVKLFWCVAASTKVATEANDLCYNEVGKEWSYSLLILPGSLFLSAFYAHSYGWLGRWLHDPFKKERAEKIVDLYQRIAEELEAQTSHAHATGNQEELANLILLSNKIKKNIPTIRSALSELLQLDPADAKRAVNYLEWACSQKLIGAEQTKAGRLNVLIEKQSKILFALQVFKLLCPSPFTIALIVYIIGKKLWTH